MHVTKKYGCCEIGRILVTHTTIIHSRDMIDFLASRNISIVTARTVTSNTCVIKNRAGKGIKVHSAVTDRAILDRFHVIAGFTNADLVVVTRSTVI